VDHDGATTDRLLEGETCEAVASAASLLVSLAIDPQLEVEPVESVESVESVEPAASTVVSDAAPRERSVQLTAPARAAVPPDTLGLQWVADVALVLDAGSLPELSPGVTLTIGIEFGAFRFGLGATLLAHQVARAVSLPSATVTVSLWTGHALAQWYPLRGAVDIGLGAGMEIGRLHGESAGVTDPGAGSHLWLAPTMETHADLHLTSWMSIAGRVAALVPLERSSLDIEGVGAMHRPSDLVVRGELGLQVLF